MSLSLLQSKDSLECLLLLHIQIRFQIRTQVLQVFSSFNLRKQAGRRGRRKKIPPKQRLLAYLYSQCIVCVLVFFLFFFLSFPPPLSYSICVFFAEKWHFFLGFSFWLKNVSSILESAVAQSQTAAPELSKTKGSEFRLDQAYSIALYFR